MKMRTCAIVFALLACAAVSAHADSITVGWTPGQTTSPVSGLSGTVTYPSSTISDSGGDVTASTTTSYGFNQGSSSFGEPYWLSLTSNPDQNITFTFAQPVDYVGFFWGSADNSNWVGLCFYSLLVSESVAPWFWLLSLPASFAILASVVATVALLAKQDRAFMVYFALVFKGMGDLGIINTKRLLFISGWLLLSFSLALANRSEERRV